MAGNGTWSKFAHPPPWARRLDLPVSPIDDEEDDGRDRKPGRKKVDLHGLPESSFRRRHEEKQARQRRLIPRPPDQPFFLRVPCCDLLLPVPAFFEDPHEPEDGKHAQGDEGARYDQPCRGFRHERGHPCIQALDAFP